jgi:hypothetical protein
MAGATRRRRAASRKADIPGLWDAIKRPRSCGTQLARIARQNARGQLQRPADEVLDFTYAMLLIIGDETLRGPD